jgi:hypothetical protein
MPPRVRCPLLAATSLLAAAALIAPATASAQTTAPSECPATFSVLHDDQIGSMSLPAGAYTVTLLDPAGLSCAEASDLFRQFLEDWDGRLPRPWVANSETRTFTRGSGGSVGFSVSRSGSHSGGGGGGHHPHGAACPGTFQVLHNDRIGTFQVPEGSYLITLLSVGRITCTQASSFLTEFLQDFDGILPTPWVLDPETGSFMRGSRNVGFRIKEAVGPPNPNGGGGGSHPTGDRCPATFRVLGNDRIGRLRLPRGRYRITVLEDGPTCARASSLFADFLELFRGNLPRPWRLNVQTATFTRGSGDTGFRVKAVRPSRGG